MMPATCVPWPQPSAALGSPGTKLTPASSRGPPAPPRSGPASTPLSTTATVTPRPVSPYVPRATSAPLAEAVNSSALRTVRSADRCRTNGSAARAGSRRTGMRTAAAWISGSRR